MGRAGVVDVKAAFLVLAATCLATPAWADWHFCLVSDRAAKRVYLSAPFLSSAASAALDADLDADLSRRRFAHDTVQCPRADDQIDALAMRQHAVRFNREFGREVFDFDWRPADAVARSP